MIYYCTLRTREQVEQFCAGALEDPTCWSNDGDDDELEVDYGWCSEFFSAKKNYWVNGMTADELDAWRLDLGGTLVLESFDMRK